MAQDNVYLELKKQAEKSNGLVNEITVRVTDEEMEIVMKKISEIGIDIGEFLRLHLLKTPAFDGSVFQDKKVKKGNKEGAN
jgi:predicted DNA binding CopG/RHH family protein